MDNKENKNAANMGYAIIITIILVIVAVFIWMAVVGVAGEWVDFGAIIGIFNLIVIIYFGKTILDKFDK